MKKRRREQNIQVAAGESTFVCTPAMCAFSPLLMVLLEAGEDESVVLPVASGAVLGYACEYLALLVGESVLLSHQGLPRPLPSHELLDFVTLAEKQFIEHVSPEDLVRLVQTANYLGITGLLALCCARIASARMRHYTFALDTRA